MPTASVNIHTCRVKGEKGNLGSDKSSLLVNLTENGLSVAERYVSLNLLNAFAVCLC